MTAKTLKVKIEQGDLACFIPITFDPKAVFGKARVPVRVTLNGYSFRSTIANMGGGPFIPLRKSNREAAQVEGGQTVSVKIELDTEVRQVAIPADLEKALASKPKARKAWEALSYTHKREYAEAIEGAKKPETRERRLANTFKELLETK